MEYRYTNKIYVGLVILYPAKDQVLLCKKEENSLWNREWPVEVLEESSQAGVQNRKDEHIQDQEEGEFFFMVNRKEDSESSLSAAYRILWDHTRISEKDILLCRLMDIRYHHQDIDLVLYVGKLEKKKSIKVRESALRWFSLEDIFSDQYPFSGKQGLAHILSMAKLYPVPERKMTQDGLYIGVDGCRGGWTGAILDHGELRFEKFVSVEEILKAYPVFDAFLIDMVIGLKDEKEQVRPDDAAKKELGKWGSSIFPIPCRQAVYAEGEEMQKEANLRVLGKSLSKQTLNILPKIRELDELFEKYPEYKNKIFESHPELVFSRLNGSVITVSKKEHLGLRMRTDILETYLGESSLQMKVYESSQKLHCNEDDLADALSLSLAGALFAHGMCETLPETPEFDNKGLLMQLTVPISRSI